jgi:hypothetical protein
LVTHIIIKDCRAVRLDLLRLFTFTQHFFFQGSRARIEHRQYIEGGFVHAVAVAVAAVAVMVARWSAEGPQELSKNNEDDGDKGKFFHVVLSSLLLSRIYVISRAVFQGAAQPVSVETELARSTFPGRRWSRFTPTSRVAIPAVG